MRAEDRIRIEVGFEGGQIGALVTPETADELEAALQAGTTARIVFDAEDGLYTVALAQVVFVKRFARESRLGFGNVSPGGARGILSGGGRPGRHRSFRAARGSDNGRIRDLVERAKRGDRDALEELYLLHFDRIYSYLHMSVGNRHDAEDLTTQTFLKMLESIGRFEWKSVPFSAWLFRIAHNLAMDLFRARQRVAAGGGRSPSRPARRRPRPSTTRSPRSATPACSS